MTAVLTPMPGVQTLSFTGLSPERKAAEIEQHGGRPFRPEDFQRGRATFCL